MNLGLRGKIVLTFIISFLLLLLIVSMFFFVQWEKIILRENRQSLIENTSLIREQIQNNHPKISSKEIDRVIDEIANQSRFRISVIDRNGVLIADSTLSGKKLAAAENHKERPEILQASAQGVGWGRRVSVTTQKEHLYYAIPLSLKEFPDSVVRLAIFMETYRELRASILIGGLSVIAGLLIILIVTSVFLSRWVLRPIQEMSRVAGQFSSQNFEEKLYINSKDEIGALASTLNQMAFKLESQLNELAKDKGQLEAVLSNMEEGVLVTSRTREILMMNPAFKVLFKTNVPTSGKTVLEHLRNVDLEDLLREAVQTAKPVRRELVLEDRTPPVILEVGSSPIVVKDQVIGVVAVFHNITEMREIERERRDFFQNVSHELRTPLTSIKGYIESLMEDYASDKDLKKNLSVVKKNADRLDELVSDIVDLSRIEVGKIKVVYDPLDVHKAFEQLSENFKSELKKRKIELVVSVPESLPLVSISEPHFEQIFSNLISNAIRYSKDNSKITISAAENPETSTVSFKVEDQGIGISKEDIPRIFERFYRVDKDRSRATGGTGLGLSITKALVEMYGGLVRVESQVDVGSVFSFNLPIYR